jgi:Putative adhesin
LKWLTSAAASTSETGRTIVRRHIRLLGAVAAAGIGVSTLGACGLIPGDTVEDSSKLKQKVDSVRLEGGSGAVRLRSKETVTHVSVHRSLEFDGDRPHKSTFHVENGVLVLTGCGEDCSVSYTVDLPPRVAVSGSTSSGGISLSGVGKVNVTSHSGAVDLQDVDGAVAVRTTNGRINGHGLKGERVRAETSNGAIDLGLSTPQDVLAKTSNGAVSVTVPDGRYNVSARTSNGHKHIGVRNERSGDHKLDLMTTNGSINVKST